MNFFESAPLQDTSVKLYNAKLNEWISYMSPISQSLLCILEHPTIAMQQLESHLTTNTPSNRHIFIVAILSFLRHCRNQLPHLTQEQYSVLRVQWIDINNVNEAPIIQRRLENRPTDLQLKKGGVHLSYTDICLARDGLPLGSTERLLIAMYTMIPPARADYFATQIIHNDEVPIEKNYIRIRGNTMECTLTDFKTAKQFKQIFNPFPADLVAEVQASLHKNPRQYLFVNANGKPHTRNSFVLWSGRALARLLDMKFTLVFFRHAYVTHFFATHDMNVTTDEEVKAISDKMGHSTEMFRAYKWVKNGAKGELDLGGEEL
jgi:hypothetical protein